MDALMKAELHSNYMLEQVCSGEGTVELVPEPDADDYGGVVDFCFTVDSGYSLAGRWLVGIQFWNGMVNSVAYAKSPDDNEKHLFASRDSFRLCSHNMDILDALCQAALRGGKQRAKMVVQIERESEP